jgi:hypothetical protein
MSNDLRIIDIDDAGSITLTGMKMHIPLNDKEAAIQRAVVALLNTGGSMADDPGFGGSGYRLYLANRKSINETTIEAGGVVSQAFQSMKNYENMIKNAYKISNMQMTRIERSSTNRGYNVFIQLDFADANSVDFDITAELQDVSS